MAITLRQLPYLKNGSYSAIRLPQIGDRTGLRGKKKLGDNVDIPELRKIEQECLESMRLLEENGATNDKVLSLVDTYDRKLGYDRPPAHQEAYLRH